MTEAEIIARFFAPLADSAGADGLQDDVATLEPPPDGQRWILTTDALAENTHFLPDDPLDAIAHKLVAVNVSDILAKGGLPKAASLSLIWPKSRPAEQIAQFAQGLGSALKSHKCTLLGGDTITTDALLCASLTLHGLCPQSGPVRRSGANPGDQVWVSGTIGDACLGLLAATGRLPETTASARARLLSCYRSPTPAPASIAEIIARHASASIDLSDGLAADANRIAHASKLALQIQVDAIPFSKEARLWMGSDQEKLLTLLCAGDDYQPLFTAPAQATADILAASTKLSRIGQCFNSPDCKAQIQLRNGRKLNMKQTGFDHFHPWS